MTNLELEEIQKPILGKIIKAENPRALDEVLDIIWDFKANCRIFGLAAFFYQQIYHAFNSKRIKFGLEAIKI